MAELLKHPAAGAKYRRRKTIVEPCFAEMKERQGLKRFRRRGMRAEFALYGIAFQPQEGRESFSIIDNLHFYPLLLPPPRHDHPLILVELPQQPKSLCPTSFLDSLVSATNHRAAARGT